MDRCKAGLIMQIGSVGRRNWRLLYRMAEAREPIPRSSGSKTLCASGWSLKLAPLGGILAPASGSRMQAQSSRQLAPIPSLRRAVHS
jgi:hypothetical protein